MDNLIFEYDNKEIKTSGSIVYRKVIGRLDININLLKPLSNYKEFSHNSRSYCKVINVYDIESKRYFKNCTLLTSNGKYFIGDCEEIWNRYER